MVRRFSSVVVVATMLASLLQGAMPAAHARGGAPTYYLALGDSLAAGFQPGKGETPGYVGMLWHGHCATASRRSRASRPCRVGSPQRGSQIGRASCRERV